MLKIEGTAPGESRRRKPAGWGEALGGKTGDNASVSTANPVCWLVRLNLPNRRIRDPYVRWCGREGP